MRRLGLAFQLIDDTLDYSVDSQKDQELDLKNGIVNAVVYEMLDAHPEKFTQFKNGLELIDVVKGIDFNSYVEKISTEAHAHLEVAKTILEKLESILLIIPEYKSNPDELKARIAGLELIISYMALRQH